MLPDKGIRHEQRGSGRGRGRGRGRRWDGHRRILGCGHRAEAEMLSEVAKRVKVEAFLKGIVPYLNDLAHHQRVHNVSEKAHLATEST